ncbi:MAG: hypothetical protein ACLPWO_03690 [Thermoplasmata archaeon]
MRAQPNAAVRRFTAVWGVSIAVKLAGIAILLLVVLKLLGGL